MIDVNFPSPEGLGFRVILPSPRFHLWAVTRDQREVHGEGFLFARGHRMLLGFPLQAIMFLLMGAGRILGGGLELQGGLG